MRRNPSTRADRATARIVRRLTSTPEAQAMPTPDSSQGQLVGIVDPVTGDWKPYGLLDITLLGMPFLLAT